MFNTMRSIAVDMVAMHAVLWDYIERKSRKILKELKDILVDFSQEINFLVNLESANKLIKYFVGK